MRLGFETKGLEAFIRASRQGFGPRGRGFDLEDRVWASKMEFGVSKMEFGQCGWDMRLEAGICALDWNSGGRGLRRRRRYFSSTGQLSIDLHMIFC